jgi:hypothetical protein
MMGINDWTDNALRMLTKLVSELGYSYLAGVDIFDLPWMVGIDHLPSS